VSIKGRLIFSRRQILPGYRLKSTDTTEIMKAEMQRGATIIRVTETFRSKDDVNGGRRCGKTAKTSQDVLNVREMEDRSFVKSNNIGAHVATSNGSKRLTDGSSTKARKIGAPKTRTVCKVNAKRCSGRRHVKRKGKGVQGEKGGRGNVNVGVIMIEISNGNRILELGILKHARIQWFVHEILGNLVKRHMLSSLHNFRFNIVVENVAKGFGIAKKDTSPSIGDSLIRTFGASRKSIDTTAKDFELTTIRILASAHLEGRGWASAMRGEIVQPKGVVKGVGPELGRQTSTK